MAVHFTFAASKALKSVPCVGNSISLLELKDAIAAPLVAALKGKKLREQFDFRVYDADTNDEIVGASARVRKNSSLLVKRVPAYVLSQQNQPPVVVSNRGLKAVNKCPENVVFDDGFGEDVYSRSSVSTVSTVRGLKAVNKCPENVIFDDGFGEDVYSRSSASTVSTVSAVSSDKVESVGKEIRKNSKTEEAIVIEGVSSRLAASAVSSEQVGKAQEEIRISRKAESQAWSETVGDIPKELMCTLCKHIMKDPMLIPCCCNSFCHNCIKVVLVGEKKCPNCESLRCNDADLLPNRHLKSMIDVYFKSNPSMSSSGSCSSQTTSSQVVGDLQPKIPHKNVPNQDIHVSKSVGSGLLGKRKPLLVSLNGGLKRTKVL